MRTPVIIPTLSQEWGIYNTLESLPSAHTEPIVAVNGGDDVSRITAIAESFGTEVFHLPQQGKLPAIQEALARLGDRALEPLIILDSDTRPVFPKKWAQGMVASVSYMLKPSSIGGPVWYNQGPLLDTALRSLRLQAIVIKQKLRGDNYGPGANMALNIYNQSTLEAILGLPHYWPGEDRAIADTIRAHHGTHNASLSPKLLALSRVSLSGISTFERMTMGRAESAAKTRAQYVQRGAPSSKPYEYNSLH